MFVLTATRVWVKSHPIQTTVHLVDGIILINPTIVTSPVLDKFGLGPDGPRDKTAAPAVMKRLGNVKAGSLYATAQSAAMGGYGKKRIESAVRVAAVASSVTLAYLQWRRRFPRR